MFNILVRLFIFLFIFQFPYISQISASQIKVHQLGNLAGSLPQLIYDLNARFISDQKIAPTQDRKNLLLLHGPSGNGKTTIAKEFANHAKAKMHEYSGANIVTEKIGSGVKKIKEIFQDAKESNQPCVIFIDGFDGIASHNAYKSRDENQLAFQQFNTEIDAIKGNSKIFVICATNYFERLPEEVKRRFGNNICRILNPDKMSRTEIIQRLLSDNKYVQLDVTKFQALLNKVNAKTEQKDLTETWQSIMTSFTELSKISFVENSHAIKAFYDHASAIEKSIREVVPFYPLFDVEKKPINGEFATVKLILENVIARFKAYIAGNNFLKTKIFNYLVEQTDGMCIGNIECIVQSLQTKYKESPDLILNEHDIDILTKPFVEELQKKKEHEKKKLSEEAKYLERQESDYSNRRLNELASWRLLFALSFNNVVNCAASWALGYYLFKELFHTPKKKKTKKNKIKDQIRIA